VSGENFGAYSLLLTLPKLSCKILSAFLTDGDGTEMFVQIRLVNQANQSAKELQKTPSHWPGNRQQKLAASRSRATSWKNERKDRRDGRSTWLFSICLVQHSL